MKKHCHAGQNRNSEKNSINKYLDELSEIYYDRHSGLVTGTTIKQRRQPGFKKQKED